MCYNYLHTGQHIITLAQEILKHPQHLIFIKKAIKKKSSLINLEFKVLPLYVTKLIFAPILTSFYYVIQFLKK